MTVADVHEPVGDGLLRPGSSARKLRLFGVRRVVGGGNPFTPRSCCVSAQRVSAARSSDDALGSRSLL